MFFTKNGHYCHRNSIREKRHRHRTRLQPQKLRSVIQASSPL